MKVLPHIVFQILLVLKFVKGQTYVETTTGASACDPGYEIITDKAECTAAATALPTKSLPVLDFNFGTVPYGCLADSWSSLIAFNIDNTLSGKAGISLVCVQSGKCNGTHHPYYIGVVVLAVAVLVSSICRFNCYYAIPHPHPSIIPSHP